MRRLALAALLVMIPLAVFAQAQPGPGQTAQARWTPERRALQRLGLTDAQVAQVLDIRAKTRGALRQGAAQVRRLRAQVDEAMLASTVDMQAVNGLVDQIAQTRAGMKKVMLAARVQMQQIMGSDNFQEYMRDLRRAMAHRFPRWRARRVVPWNGADGLWI